MYNIRNKSTQLYLLAVSLRASSSGRVQIVKDSVIDQMVVHVKFEAHGGRQNVL